MGKIGFESTSFASSNLLLGCEVDGAEGDVSDQVCLAVGSLSSVIPTINGVELNNVSTASLELERLNKIDGEHLDHLERHKIAGATATGEEQTTHVQRQLGVC